MIFLKENAHCQENRKKGNAKFLLKTIEKSQFLGTIDFGAVLGGFGEGFGKAQIIDFPTFFDVFSKLISKRVSKGEKNGPRREKDGSCGTLDLDSGGPQAPGERL